MKYQRPTATTRCVVCGALFLAERFRVVRGMKKCCSISCRGRWAATGATGTGRKPLHGGCVGGKPSPLYRRWAGIKSRCHSKFCVKFGAYGARGIRMCKQWFRSFSKFRDWAVRNGFSPELQIDRIDNGKGYSPSNCRWVTCVQNAANRRRSLIFPTGETTAQVAKRIGLTPSALRYRIQAGMTLRQAMTIPPIPNGQARKTFNVSEWEETK